jgi:putative ABC transport system permease protein
MGTRAVWHGVRLWQRRESSRMERASRIIRYAFSSVWRTPGFTLVVVLVLGLGVGAAVVTFSVVDAVLLRALPYPAAERLMMLDADLGTRRSVGVSPLEQVELAARSASIDAIATLAGVNANLNIDGALERVFAVSANDDALVMFGAEPPALGRLTRDREDVNASGPVSAVVISDGLWRRHFGANPQVIGRRVLVNGLDVQIVGVLRPGLRLFLPAVANVAEEVDLWFPRGHSMEADVRGPATLVRLAPGVSAADAARELAHIAREVTSAHAGVYGADLSFSVTPLETLLTARTRPALVALALAVGLC